MSNDVCVLQRSVGVYNSTKHCVDLLMIVDDQLLMSSNIFIDVVVLFVVQIQIQMVVEGGEGEDN